MYIGVYVGTFIANFGEEYGDEEPDIMLILYHIYLVMPLELRGYEVIVLMAFIST
jgi:hypothetical protein